MAFSRVVRILPWKFVPFDRLTRLSQRIAATLAGGMFLRDWQLQAGGRPQFFKHQINICRWPFAPQEWAFVARGVYARESMFRGCRVLDLCCGDGSYSHLFFSDIAGVIHAIDNDPHAIDYARRFHQASTITYQKLDILKDPWPGDQYDVVVWNAAICYFSAEEIDLILRKIVQASRGTGRLAGMLPKANGWVDHKTEFAEGPAVAALLGRYFQEVAIKEIEEGTGVTFYFQACRPLVPMRERDETGVSTGARPGKSNETAQ